MAKTHKPREILIIFLLIAAIPLAACASPAARYASGHLTETAQYSTTDDTPARVSATEPPTSSPTTTSSATPVYLIGCVEASSLRVRSGPSTDHAMIGGLLAGDCVTVLGKNSAADWAKVSFEDVIGWVSVAYLSIEGDLQNASVVSEEPDGQNHTTASPSSAPKPPTTPIPTSAPLPSSGFACVPKNTQRKTGQVVSVTDGDTIRVRIDGWNYPVRYIGIDTPEMDGYFGAEARSQNYRLVAGRKVTLVKDVSYTDQYGRLLRYVFVGDTFVNYELAQSGYAQAATYPPDVACSALFKSAASDARYADRGLWRPTTTPYPTAAAQQAGSSGNCHPSYPAVCIPPPPPDLDCKDVPFRRFSVVGSDPHRFDGDHDGVGCEW